MSQKYQFLHFGCWASKNAENIIQRTDKNHIHGVDEVMNLVYIHSMQENVKFCIVSGDNYYANRKTEAETESFGKKKQKKVWKRTEMDQYFDTLIKNMNQKPIRLLTGNHDLESHNPQDWDFEDLDNTNNERCATTNFEIFKCENTPDLSCKARQDYTSYYDLDEQHNTLFLYLNTTIYDEYPKRTHLTESEYCETVWLKQSSGDGASSPRSVTNTGSSTDETRTGERSVLKSDHIEDRNTQNQKNAYFQLNNIQMALTNKQNDIKNIIIVGHHPIYGVKYKAGKNVSQHWNENGFELLKSVFDCYKDIAPNFIYLCADIHHYQKNNLTITFKHSTGDDQPTGDDHPTMTITQYIVGTGGASQDDIPTDVDYNNIYSKTTPQEFKNKYDIVCTVDTSDKNFGLQIATYNSTNCTWDFVFHPITLQPSTQITAEYGGKRRRTQRKHMWRVARTKRPTKQRCGRTHHQKRKRRTIRK